jgi:hypothetical protein
LAGKDSTSVGGTLMPSGTTGTDIFSVEVRSQLATERASNPGRINAGKLFFIITKLDTDRQENHQVPDIREQ